MLGCDQRVPTLAVEVKILRRFQHISVFVSLCGVMRLLDVSLDVGFSQHTATQEHGGLTVLLLQVRQSVAAQQ